MPTERETLRNGGIEALKRHRAELEAATNARQAARDDPAQRRAIVRASWLKSEYGITQEEYEALLAVQEGKCAVCGSADSGRRGGVMVVDHDHTTRAIRGLLCDSCNKMIGFAHDDPDVLRAAANHIDRRAR